MRPILSLSQFFFLQRFSHAKKLKILMRPWWHNNSTACYLVLKKRTIKIITYMNWLEGVLTYFILLFKLGPVSFTFVNFTTDYVLVLTNYRYIHMKPLQGMFMKGNGYFSKWCDAVQKYCHAHTKLRVVDHYRPFKWGI